MEVGAPINKKYYIIKVNCNHGEKVYYKIGEGNTEKRPESLVEKYNKLRANEATLLFIDDLPTTKEKRLNDKLIHRHIDPKVLKRANEFEIQVRLNETDGKDEFFELVDQTVNVEDYIKGLVETINKSEYTARAIYATTLEYQKDSYHLVSSNMIKLILANFKLADRMLYRENNNNILLIGQFAFEFISTIATNHNVIIWHDSTEQRHEYEFSRINDKISYINNFEELLNMNIKFDLIIANPPYGAIGANITKNIIDNIDYDEYINLLPANDYKFVNGLHNYVEVDTMVVINNGFEDAVVNTLLSRIHKNTSNYISFTEFRFKSYLDRILDKYFIKNDSLTHYAIDNYKHQPRISSFKTTYDLKKCIYFGKRDIAAHKMPTTGIGFKVNKLRNVTHDDVLFAGAKSEQALGHVGDFDLIQFNSEIEQINAMNFAYSDAGFKFLSKVFTSVNAVSYVKPSTVFPKVDWTRSWTVEEILTEYGYDNHEIQEVMSDLVNFKGMDE